MPGRRIRFVAAKQPALPARMPNGEPWPAATRAWWRMWRSDPRAERFTLMEWSYLRDTAALHGAVWSGDLRLAGELRHRMSKFAVTPEDQQHLRIRYDTPVESDGAEEAKATLPKGATSRERYGHLRVVDAATRARERLDGA